MQRCWTTKSFSVHCYSQLNRFARRKLARSCFVTSDFYARRHKSTESPQFTSSKKHATPGFIFDIDGVLKIGQKVLPQGREALRVLNGENKLGRRFPFILVTNGGGITEEERCHKLSKELGVNIDIGQLIQAHTVFREHAKDYADKPILVVGGNGENCRKVATSYGFTNCYTPLDLLAWNPAIWPFRKPTEEQQRHLRKEDFSKIAFKAVFVFHDSRDWGMDTQIMTDVLASPNGIVGTWRDMAGEGSEAEWQTPHLPVFFSNPDLLWGNDYSEPRYGQGAFQEAFRAVWKRTTGQELRAATAGKPTNMTYRYAERLLLAQANNPSILPQGVEQTTELGPTYMVGDNPDSDIAGANAFGIHSILVRTGVFRGKDNHHLHPATSVQPDVLAGVRWALKREVGGDI